MKIFFLRHAEDAPDIIGGWSDIGLTELGKRQAEEVKAYIIEHQNEMDIKHVISSEMLRTHLTVEPIAEALSLTVEENELWNGLNQGELNGYSSQKAKELYPYLNLKMMDFDEEFPKGESPKNFQKRVISAWLNLWKEYNGKNQNILVCTHGLNMFVLNLFLQGKKWNYRECQNFQPCVLLTLDTNLKTIDLKLLAK